jgi:hypothetical protein
MLFLTPNPTIGSFEIVKTRQTYLPQSPLYDSNYNLLNPDLNYRAIVYRELNSGNLYTRILYGWYGKWFQGDVSEDLEYQFSQPAFFYKDFTPTIPNVVTMAESLGISSLLGEPSYTLSFTDSYSVSVGDTFSTQFMLHSFVNINEPFYVKVLNPPPSITLLCNDSYKLVVDGLVSFNFTANSTGVYSLNFEISGGNVNLDIRQVFVNIIVF